jgi:hypothetical protein
LNAVLPDIYQYLPAKRFRAGKFERNRTGYISGEVIPEIPFLIA